MESIRSKIQSVTVYPNQAEVHRQVTCELGKGSHIIQLDGLPSNLQNDSIQIFAPDGLQLVELSLQRKELLESGHKGLLDLQYKKRELKKKEEALLARRKRFEEEKAFLDGIRKRLEGVPEKASDTELDPDSWTKMTTFYTENHARLDDALLKLNPELEELAEQINWIDRQIKQVIAPGKIEKQLRLRLIADETGRYEMGLQYLIQGASWKPIYDLQVNTQTETIHWVYKAMIHQQTGEDWAQVDMRLSTAKVNTSGSLPELNAWTLRKYQPKPPPPAEMARRTMSRGVGAPLAKASPAPAAQAPIRRQTAVHHEQATSALFELPGKITIPSGKEASQNLVMEAKLPAEMSYLAIPRLANQAYLKGKIINQSGVPMLAAKANVFIDGQYVGNTQVPQTAAEETFEVGLGVDPGIKVERKKFPDYRKNQGVIGSKRDKKTVRHEIRLHNLKSKPVKILVQDQYPVSEDQDIKVELEKPVYRSETAELKIDAQHIIHWNKMLGPNEKLNLELEFSVSFPKGLHIDGLP